MKLGGVVRSDYFEDGAGPAGGGTKQQDVRITIEGAQAGWTSGMWRREFPDWYVTCVRV